MTTDRTADPRPARGRAAEERAVEYLLDRGYRVVGRNVRTRLGELDVVALDGPTVVFVEVRSRKSDRFGRAVESVNATKRRRLGRAASLFLAKQGFRGRPARFDVIGIETVTGVLEHIEDAFELEE